jgi:hypothetical protein
MMLKVGAWMVVLALVALPGMGDVSWEWFGQVGFLSNEGSFSLGYTFANAALTPTKFTLAGQTRLGTNPEGAFGSVSPFSSLVPTYLYNQLTLRTNLAGVETELRVGLLASEGVDAVPAELAGGAVVRLSASLGGETKLASITGFGPKSYPNGLGFTGQKLSLTGHSYTVVLSFTRAGFQYAELAVEDLCPQGLGLSLGISARLAPAAQIIGIAPKFEGLGEARFELYVTAGENRDFDIAGYRISYKITEDIAIEILSAPDVAMVEQILGENLFEQGEFEYLKLSFARPGWHGHEYIVDLSMFPKPSHSLFGSPRFGADISIPVLPGLTLTASFGIRVGGDATLDFGWSFTF